MIEEAGPDDDTDEAGENGAEDGDEFENGDEMSAAGGFDVPEPMRRSTGST